MTIREVLKKYSKNLEIELPLAHVLEKPKEFLYMNINRRLNAGQIARISRIAKRRMRGEPTAYILGYKDFYGLRFKVNKSVLIPRPETEEVVNKVLQVCKAHKVKELIRILDLGTGSGCIAISLAQSLAKVPFVKLNKGHLCKIAASDISPKALQLARRNAKTILGKNFHTAKYGRIQFVKSDLLQSIKFTPTVIIANLPYGWDEWKNNLSEEAKGLNYEPKNALFTKEKGLYLYRKLLEQIAARKNQPKLVYLEFDPRQKQNLHRLIKKNLPKAEIKFYKDFNGLWRYVEITL